jgi:hypothetical protein
MRIAGQGTSGPPIHSETYAINVQHAQPCRDLKQPTQAKAHPTPETTETKGIMSLTDSQILILSIMTFCCLISAFRTPNVDCAGAEKEFAHAQREA